MISYNIYITYINATGSKPGVTLIRSIAGAKLSLHGLLPMILWIECILYFELHFELCYVSEFLYEVLGFELSLVRKKINLSTN